MSFLKFPDMSPRSPQMTLQFINNTFSKNPTDANNFNFNQQLFNYDKCTTKEHCDSPQQSTTILQDLNLQEANP